jgi:hypothetical protein
MASVVPVKLADGQFAQLQLGDTLADAFIASAGSWNGKQTAYSLLSSFGALASGTGWLHNNGAGVFAYSAPTKSDVGLGSVENTALSTWAGSANVTTLGTIATGVWHGTAIADTYISSAATWNAKQVAYTNLTTFGSLSNAAGYLHNDGSGVLSYSSITVPTAANPTASLGLTAINGSAATFMRSDAAPALNVGITPTWTGSHAFQKLSLASVTTDWLFLRNTSTATASGAGKNQWSPAFIQQGAVYDTALSGSKTILFRQYITTDSVGGSSVPFYCTLNWEANYAGGGYQNIAQLDLNGNFLVLGSFQCASLTLTNASGGLLSLGKGMDGNTYEIDFAAPDSSSSVVTVNGNTTLDQPVDTTASPTFVALMLSGLPTSSAGLTTGQVWCDTTGGLNILKIK